MVSVRIDASALPPLVAEALSQLPADPAAREVLGTSAATRAATFGWMQTDRSHPIPDSSRTS